MSYTITSQEKAFLSAYDPDKYKKPAVTADIAVFTIDQDDQLDILLIKRGNYPYKGCLALPGGFLDVDKESVDEAAMRELKEETGVENAFLKQLYTFGDPGRDPRMHVVSVAYTALIPRDRLKFRADDDAADAALYQIKEMENGLFFANANEIHPVQDLAFDHEKIIRMALERIRNRIEYEDDAFELLPDKKSFTIHELKKIHECILSRKLNRGNFHTMFMRNYVSKGIVIDKHEKRNGAIGSPAGLYEYIGREAL